MTTRRIVGVVGLIVSLQAVSACGSGDETEPPTKRATSASSPTEPAPTSIDAKGMERDVRAPLGGKPITSMCAAAYTHWACFYNGVEAGPSYLRVNLTTDRGPSDEEETAQAAGQQWFSFIHCDYPDLTTIVVTIDGVDHSVYLKDTKAGLGNC